MVFNHDYKNIIMWFHVGCWMYREKWFSVKEKKMQVTLPKSYKACSHIQTLLASVTCRSAGNTFKQIAIFFKIPEGLLFNECWSCSNTSRKKNIHVLNFFICEQSNFILCYRIRWKRLTFLDSSITSCACISLCSPFLLIL